MVIMQLFSVTPPRELSDDVARAFGLADIEDGSPFTRHDVAVRGVRQHLAALRPRLASVYIPCKAAVYVYEDISPDRCLTILRHFLKAGGLSLSVEDVNCDGRRTQVYRIRRVGEGLVRMSRGNYVL